MKKVARILGCAALLLAAPRAALAQSIAVGAGPSVDESVAAPPEAPAWAMYYHPGTGSYIKPVLGISGGFNYEHRRNIDTNTGSALPLSALKTAYATVLFGFEGKVGSWATFHSEFRRDAGHYGTSVWQGTVSLSAMDNYVRLEHWGASLAAGIVSDPSSFDFVSMHILDAFLTDDYTLLPALHSGANRSQGVFARYTWKGLTAGLFFGAGNPLTTSLSWGWGGNVSPFGGLYATPLGQLSQGEPRNGIEMDVLSPSLMFEHKYVDVRANAQFYWVNLDTESGLAASMKGKLLRGGIRGKIWDNHIVPFANIAYRTNEMPLQAPALDVTQKNPLGYSAWTASGGLDLNLFGLSGVGVNYAMVHIKKADEAAHTDHYLNVGATYWIIPHVAVGARYAKLITTTERTEKTPASGLGAGTIDGRMDRDALFFNLRLVL
jgi:hypothetical protein